MKRYLQDHALSDIKRKLVILTGPRQVGKTYMGRQLMSQFKTPLYLNWDIPEDRVRLQTQSRYDHNDLVIMDEIHKMTNWKQWLKGITDARSPGTALLVTGSARMDTFRQAGESLAGRYYSYRMHPISVKELCFDTQIKPREALDHLLERGGFPEPCLADQLELVLRWRTDYAKDILREDILYEIEETENNISVRKIFKPTLEQDIVFTMQPIVGVNSFLNKPSFSTSYTDVFGAKRADTSYLL